LRRFTLLVAMTALSPLVLAACGGEQGDWEAAGRRIECRGSGIVGGLGLPWGFPAPTGLTATGATSEGPTRVVVGYFEEGLDDAHRMWKDALELAGYRVTFDEVENRDAEVAYSGVRGSGIVQIRDRCQEAVPTRGRGRFRADDIVYVRITSRPA